MNRIFREKHTDNFTVLPNAIFKSGLSLKAIGLLTYILHLPDDWVLYKTYLYETLPRDGRDSIKSAWQELEEKGFIVIDRKSGGGKGKLPETNYIVYDSPVKMVGFPSTGFPQRNIPPSNIPLRKNSTLLSTKEQRTNELSTKEQNDLVPVGTIEPSPTVNLELEKVIKKSTDRLPIPDDSSEMRKERERYEVDIVPLLRNIDITDAGRKLVEYIKEKKPAFYEPYKDLWNISAGKFDLQQVKKLSDGRLQKFKARLKDPDFDFLEIMMGIKKSRMLKGDNERGWKVDWDFIFKNDTNYLKIIEGKYQ